MTMHFRPAFLALLWVLPVALSAATPEGVRYIEGNRPAGMSAAVVVDHQALAHTAQVFPTGPRGEAPSGEAEAQVERTLVNLSTTLELVGSRLDRIVRLNVYVADPSVTASVEKVLARRFAGTAKPVVTLVGGKLPAAGALVAMDAVGTAPPGATHGAVVRQTSRVLPAEARESHVAVLPAGPVLFISGRAEPGSLEKAARDTIARLYTDLGVLGLQKSDVVQLKAFVSPIESADIVRREIRAFYGNDAVPPLVFVEWHSASRPVEIELVAAARVRSGLQPDTAVEYLTPPGEPTNPLFTRLVRVNRGKLVFIAGLFGETDREAEPQLREMFSQLGGVLQQAGSDLEHMAKATYYVTDNPSSTFLNSIRTQLYNPKRTPASSKLSVTGTGRAAKSVTFDMIAVVP